jgi:ATP-binding cassette subfamily F protein 3
LLGKTDEPSCLLPSKTDEPSPFVSPVTPTAPAPTRKTKEQRRVEAESRNRAYRLLKEDRKRLKEVEAQLDADTMRHDELVELMASEDLYQEKEAFDKTLTEYNRLRKRIPQLEAEWFEITQRIEHELDSE